MPCGKRGFLCDGRTCWAGKFLRIAKEDMAVYPGDRLKDWEPYWHGAMQYRDQRDFDHLFDALRKAGFSD